MGTGIYFPQLRVEVRHSRRLEGHHRDGQPPATEPTNDPVHPNAAPTNGPSGACHGAGTELNLTTRPDPCSPLEPPLELCPRSPTLRTVTPPGNAPGWHRRSASKSNRGCCNVADTSTIAARTNTVRA
jgi:hypothetical protein